MMLGRKIIDQLIKWKNNSKNSGLLTAMMEEGTATAF